MGRSAPRAMTRPDERAAFVAKVVRLKAEGLSTRAVAERLGVPVATINDRLRKERWKGDADGR